MSVLAQVLSGVDTVMSKSNQLSAIEQIKSTEKQQRLQEMMDSELGLMWFEQW